MEKNFNVYLPVLIDSSSLIILNHADILDFFVNKIKTYSTKRVLNEVKVKDSSISRYFDTGKIRVLSFAETNIKGNKLSATDKELIEIALKKELTPVTDDKGIIDYCVENKLQFLNSMTAVVLLFDRGYLELNKAYGLIKIISKAGRYSKGVITYAFSLLP